MVSLEVLVAVNPKSGTGSGQRLIAGLTNALQLGGWNCHVSDSLDQVQHRAGQLWAQQRLAAVVSAGGDGTVSALVNHLPTEVPILIFPLGTENLLARHWGLTCDAQQACNTLRAGRCVHMDVGCANGRLFLVMLSCGFDAQVVQALHAKRHGHIRQWTYAWPILRTWATYRFPLMGWHVVGGAKSEVRQRAWIFIFNVPRYAAGLPFCPQADPLDGRLDVCTFTQGGTLSSLYYLYRLCRGTHFELDDFEHSVQRSLRIDPPLDGTGKPLQIPYQIDGDPGGYLPVNLQVQPARVRLLVPETTQTGDPLPVQSLAWASG
ncbi:MAG: NAD(+)/NADH kinase [Pirellulaceae bacterium]|nr:NAD(+)/NADH kinase [Pirellulaceae bacterium]